MQKLLLGNMAMASALKLEQTLAKIGRRPAPALTEDEIANDIAMRASRHATPKSSKPASRESSAGRLSMQTAMARPQKRAAVSSGRRAPQLNPNAR